METQTPPHATRRRLLMTAYHYDRAYSMESRLAWQRAQAAARDYDVTVLCARPPIDADDLAVVTSSSGNSGVGVELLPLSRTERALMAAPGLYYFGYRLWHRRALQRARVLHAERPFSLVHHVSFCGYREPSDCWKLGAPFVWGPVGGTQPFPRAFLGELDRTSALREVVRNVANRLQLRFDPRVRRAARQSACVLAANRAVANDLAEALKIQPLVQLETGVDPFPQAEPRSADDSQPLRILWAGRLQPWKGLPLLLKALAALPSDVRYELRVLGQGPCESRWRCMAGEIGIAANIEWVGWPAYEGQLPFYAWADVFAFTSLRDTSGTGLLEALAAGAPIVGVNHQGAADVMTARCAMPVDVATPHTAINGFRDAISKLAANRGVLASLSAGALQRSSDFAWERQWTVLKQVYAEAERRSAAASSPTITLAIPEPAVRELELVETFS
jgi:glycosyltransferase involved in cell wall biosynthesis